MEAVQKEEPERNEIKSIEIKRKERERQIPKKRYELLDVLRGLTLISMILYHLVWDLVYIEGMQWGWFRTGAARVWQQSICWTFILLSGFCWSLGRHKLRRGLTVFGAGWVVTLVTCIFTPGQRIVFGILTLLGSCMLLLTWTEGLWRRVPAKVGAIVSFLLFLLLKPINKGYLGIGGWRLDLPQEWYHMGDAMTFLGFLEEGFFSTDYFSLLPWLLLFLTGYFLYRVAEQLGWLRYCNCPVWGKGPLPVLGKYSLIIYMLHQPVIYGCLQLLF